MAYKRLGEILTSAGIISQEQLDNALAQSKITKKRLGEELVAEQVLSERDLIDVLTVQLGIDFIDLTRTEIPTALAQYVSKNVAKKYLVVPVRQQGDTLYLAMQDPLNYKAVEEVRASSRKRVIPMIATRNAIEYAINMLYGNESVSRAIDDLRNEMGLEAQTTEQTETKSADEDTQAAPAIRLVNSIIERAAGANASDVHIEPRDNGLNIRMRIDGVLHPVLTVPSNLQNAVISRIKIMGDMDIAERRIPQDGRSNIKVRGKEYDLRISTLPTKYGEKIVIRFLEKSATLMSTSGIGLEGKLLEDYEALIHNSNGVILISGPTGSGKSTTMYTMISELNKDTVNLVTLEDPVEYDMSGVNQVQINEKVGMTFAGGLRSILRQDPDIIAVGEIRDGETAEIAMRAAITGHLVVSTIHTNSSVATLDRLIDIGVEPYLITSALKGVIAQRLLRRLCPKCRQAYKPDSEELLSVGMDPEADVTFYKAVGCPDCLNTGYKGRIAVFEILMLGHELKKKFREGASSAEILETARGEGFKTMLENSADLIARGITTTEEAGRILNSTD